MYRRALVVCLALAACAEDRADTSIPPPGERIERVPARPDLSEADVCWAPLPDAPDARPVDGTADGPTTAWFETLCPAEVTPSRISALQRALAARSLYIGPVTGELDTATRAALRTYQARRGLDSGTLSRTAARQMGLVPIARPPPR